MTAVAGNPAVQLDTVSTASLNQNIGRFYSAMIGGSAPVPPQELVLVPIGLLKQYERMVRALEESAKRDRQLLFELLRHREEAIEPDVRPFQLSPSAVDVVNSLLQTVPASNIRREEVDEL